MINYKKVKEILENVSMREVVSKAYYATCDGSFDGVAQINLQTGEILAATYSTGQYDADDEWMDLYEVSSCTEYPSDELFSEIEDEIPEDMDEYEYCEENEIDVDELKIDYLLFYAEENDISEKWLKDLDELIQDEQEESDELDTW